MGVSGEISAVVSGVTTLKVADRVATAQNCDDYVGSQGSSTTAGNSTSTTGETPATLLQEDTTCYIAMGTFPLGLGHATFPHAAG